MKGWKTTVKKYGVIFIGSIIFALSFDCFFAPNLIAMGGVTGLAQILNKLFPVLTVGVLVTAMNIPLFWAGWRYIGKELLISSLIAMVISSAAIDLFPFLFAFKPIDTMLAAIFGGVLQGFGLGLVFSQGATTGGSDIAARLLKLKFRWMPVSKLILIPDVLILTLASITFGQFESVLYGLLALWVTSKVMDIVMYGLEVSKIAFIITSEWEKTKDEFLALDRGVTILHGKGGYSHNEKEILMIAFSQREIVEIRRIVNENDPKSFMMVCNAYEVLGDGFREYTEKTL